MGTQKNRLNETVLLSTQNICSIRCIRKYLQFYAQKFCLSKPMDERKQLTKILWIGPYVLGGLMKSSALRMYLPQANIVISVFYQLKNLHISQV